MHVARIHSGYTDRAGRRRQYESAYLRRTYRDGGKVRHETLASLSGLPDRVVDSIDAALKGAVLVPAGDVARITRSLPHGHVAAVHAMAVKQSLPDRLGPACPHRDLALTLIVSRVIAPASGLSAQPWWADTTLGVDLGTAAASASQIRAALDWLGHRAGDGVEGDVLICRLGGLLTSQLRRAWAPLTVTGQDAPAPAGSGPGFRGLLLHLATLTRNQVRFAGNSATVLLLTEPTSTQREAFDLIGAPIPLTIK